MRGKERDIMKTCMPNRGSFWGVPQNKKMRCVQERGTNLVWNGIS